MRGPCRIYICEPISEAVAVRWRSTEEYKQSAFAVVQLYLKCGVCSSCVKIRYQETDNENVMKE
jgi:hypothetical protein